MARVEPIPYEDLDEDTRERIEAGRATGMYTTPLPLQIVAHSKVALRAMDESYKAQFRCGALDDRLHELVRLRSAQLGACEPCSLSRKDETVTEDQVACLVDPDPSVFSRREVLALQFLDVLATDHHAVDDDTFRQLATGSCTSSTCSVTANPSCERRNRACSAGTTDGRRVREAPSLTSTTYRWRTRSAS